jgi:hypothetical protein
MIPFAINHVYVWPPERVNTRRAFLMLLNVLSTCAFAILSLEANS